MAYKYSFGIWLPRLEIGANTVAAGTGRRMNCYVGTFTNLDRTQGVTWLPRASRAFWRPWIKWHRIWNQRTGGQEVRCALSPFQFANLFIMSVSVVVPFFFPAWKKNVSFCLHLPTTFFLKPNSSFTSNLVFIHFRIEESYW